MKLVVTGGAGFIGSNFIRYILSHHPRYTIRDLDKLTYSGNLHTLRDVEKNKRHTFVRGDIGDRRKVQEVMKGADAIVHFAAESHVDRSILDSTAFSSVRDKRAYSEEDDEDKCLLLGINVSRVLIGYPE